MIQNIKDYGATFQILGVSPEMPEIVPMLHHVRRNTLKIDKKVSHRTRSRTSSEIQVGGKSNKYLASQAIYNSLKAVK